MVPSYYLVVPNKLTHESEVLIEGTVLMKPIPFSIHCMHCLSMSFSKHLRLYTVYIINVCTC